MENQRERISTLLFYVLILLLGYFLHQIFQPFLMPLAWAAVLAIFIFPWHEKLVRRVGRPRAAALSTVIVTLLLLGPGFMIVGAFVREASIALQELDRDAFSAPIGWLSQRWRATQTLVPWARGMDLQGLIDQSAQRVAAFIAERAGGLVADLARFVFDLFVMLFALFFLLRDAPVIVGGMRRVLPFDDVRRERMMRQTQNLVYASLTSGLTIAVLQGTLGGILFAVLGLDAPVFWGVVMGFFSFLPFFGTWVVWGPAAAWLFLTGHVTKGILLVVLGATVVGSVDNVVRPAMLSGRAQMNGLLMFISLLGGMSVFGLIGLVLGPLVVALAAGLLEAYAERIEPASRPDPSVPVV